MAVRRMWSLMAPSLLLESRAGPLCVVAAVQAGAEWDLPLQQCDDPHCPPHPAARVWPHGTLLLSRFLPVQLGVRPQQQQGGGAERDLQQGAGQRGEQLGGADPRNHQGGQRHAWEQGMLRLLSPR